LVNPYQGMSNLSIINIPNDFYLLLVEICIIRTK